MSRMPLVYYPRVLRNLAAIMEHMGVGKETVKKWADMGAPIAVEQYGRSVRYSAEMGALQQWRAQMRAREEKR